MGGAASRQIHSRHPVHRAGLSVSVTTARAYRDISARCRAFALDLASLQHAAKPLPPQRARNRALCGDQPYPELLNENNLLELAGAPGFEPGNAGIKILQPTPPETDAKSRVSTGSQKQVDFLLP